MAVPVRKNRSTVDTDNTAPMYRVAVQKVAGGDIDILNIREPDYSQLHSFIARIYDKKNLSELSFCEIHRIYAPGGGVQVLYSSSNVWPIGKRNEKHGVIARNTRSSMTLSKEVNKLLETSRQTLPATIVAPAIANVSTVEHKETNVPDIIEGRSVPYVERDTTLNETRLFNRPLSFKNA